MDGFTEIKPCDLNFSPFALREKWMLITARKSDGSVNTMTASWGGFGILWELPVAFIFIRPQRYTREFVDAADAFSLTFFDESWKKKLGYLGRTSGRDEDKIEKAGLTVLHDNNIPWFQEAETAVFARKLYAQQTDAQCFVDKSLISAWYPNSDHHIVYVGEITKVLKAGAQI